MPIAEPPLSPFRTGNLIRPLAMGNPYPKTSILRFPLLIIIGKTGHWPEAVAIPGAEKVDTSESAIDASIRALEPYDVPLALDARQFNRTRLGTVNEQTVMEIAAKSLSLGVQMNRQEYDEHLQQVQTILANW